MIIKCTKCNKEFNKQPNQIRRVINNFCSRSCANSYNNGAYPKRKSKKWQCLICGTGLLYRRKYCDQCKQANKKTIWPSQTKPIESFLVSGRKCGTDTLRKRLLNESLFDNCCQRCRFTEWQGQPISLELHHIDGDKANNLLSNLTILCPNCHALTDTYRGKNKKN